MSTSPVLRAASRSAYRDLLRAASFTFYGDTPLLQAFRLKIRSDIQQHAESLEKQTRFIRDVADVLRKNIVQGQKLTGSDVEEGAVYRLRMNKFTELGDNSTIKNPPPMESARSARKRSKTGEPSATFTVAAQAEDSSLAPLPRNFSALKKAHKQRVIPELLESDLEETFVRGSGPGGQSINKTENNVQLVHKLSGIRVSCQETRSLAQNRKLARKLLLEKLDRRVNPGLSKEDIKAAKQRERQRQRQKKARKKAKKIEEELFS